MDPRDELDAYLDDELSEEERARLEEAMASDPSLRAEHDELAALVGDLRSLGEVEAPPNFLAGVMARVEAGEGIGDPLFEDEDEDEDSEETGPGLSLIDGGGDSEPELPDNVVRMPWWVKGPVLTAVAALLVVGIGYQMRGDLLGEPPAAAEVAMRPASDAAPVPTGAVADDFDAVVSVEAEEAPVAERLRMNGPTGESVAVGGAGSGATLRSAPPPKPKSTGLREVAAEPPTGIVRGNFDRAELGYSPEPEEADADAVAAAEPAELVPSDPAGALALAPAAEGQAGERAAMTAVAKLTTSDSSAIMQIRDGAEARGWSISFMSPRDGPVILSDALTEQVVEIVMPTGSEPAAQALLEAQGTFSFTSTSAGAESDQSRLRVTIVYRP